MVITIGGQKGGTGKTTIAVEFAMHLAQQGKVLFVDADPQASSTDFCNARREEKGDCEFTAVQLQGKAVRSEIVKLRDQYDHVIIDAGGYDSAGQRYAISVSDVHLTVFKPESLALWTLEAVEQMVEEMAPANPDLRALSLLNLGWPVGRDNEESAEILTESEIITFIPHMIQRRKAFCDATGRGLSVKERKPYDRKAQSEISKVVEFVLDSAAVTV